MDILRYVLILLTLCGCLRPASWTSRPKKFLYYMYTVALFLVSHGFLLTLLLDIVFNVENQYEFTDNFYLTIETIGCCWKMSGLLMNIENFLNLIRILHLEPLAPVNAYEIEIRTRFDKIVQFATMVNEEFKGIMFIQFLVSTLALCSALYRFTQGKLGSRLIETVSYTSCVLIQALYYCWYGNEVREKSLSVPEMITDSNWIALDNDSKKILLMIMKRATVPIEFNSFHIAAMDIPTFMALMKTAYSAYNVLQQGQG